MNEKQIAIGEMGGRGEGDWDGGPGGVVPEDGDLDLSRVETPLDDDGPVESEGLTDRPIEIGRGRHAADSDRRPHS